MTRLEQCAGRSPKAKLLTLTVLESCVKNCRRELGWVTIQLALTIT